MLTPTMHKPVPIGTRVIVEAPYAYDVPGTVQGIAHVHVIFHYIVVLDNPIDSEFGLLGAIAVPGGGFRSEVDGSNWRLDLRRLA